MAVWSRIATAGLFLVVLLVSGFALWASQTTADAARRAAAATRLATDYMQAAQAVAEGVEDADTYAALARYGCTIAQGYHLSRPLPTDAFDIWYADRRTPDLITSPRSPTRRS